MWHGSRRPGRLTARARCDMILGMEDFNPKGKAFVSFPTEDLIGISFVHEGQEFDITFNKDELIKTIQDEELSTLLVEIMQYISSCDAFSA